LKTTYYLRSLGATQIEKSTLDGKKFGFTQKREYTQPLAAQAPTPEATPTVEAPAMESPAATAPLEAAPGNGGLGGGSGRSLMPSRQPEANLCRIDDPDCEACQ
jgi:ribonucleoside-diphosphate reductase alpha chain